MRDILRVERVDRQFEERKRGKKGGRKRDYKLTRVVVVGRAVGKSRA